MIEFGVPQGTNPKIVTVAQMVTLEQASERHGVSTDTLMENAGLAVAQAGRRLLGGGIAAVPVLVLVGPGNNGADGLVAARHLQRWGARVTAYLVTERRPPDPKMDLALGYGIDVSRCSADPELTQLNGLLSRCRLIIDAVLGTGNSRPLTGPVGAVMFRLAQRSLTTKVLALDLPSGLNADSGAVDPACPVVDVTVALGRPKAGLLVFPGAAHVGQLEVADIGLPEDLAEDETIDLELLAPGWVGQRLPTRPPNSHKGTFGHALVVAGSSNYVGAAFLASQAAVRVGAGLVTLATPRSVYPIAASKLTEAIHMPLPEDDDGRVTVAGAQLIKNNLGRYSATLVGCGLGFSAGTKEFLAELLLSRTPTDQSATSPVIIDADGLNNLSQFGDWWRRLAQPAVVTPHPGEMATLTGLSTAELQLDRVGSARHWASHWGVTVALKGAYTVVAEPGGESSVAEAGDAKAKSRVRVAPFSNPGLASGGTGDVLSGIIVGLMAQGLSPTYATCCGVFLHGHAGESVRRRLGDSGMVASDLLDELPGSLNHLRRVGGGQIRYQTS